MGKPKSAAFLQGESDVIGTIMRVFWKMNLR